MAVMFPCSGPGSVPALEKSSLMGSCLNEVLLAVGFFFFLNTMDNINKPIKDSEKYRTV